MKVFDNYEISPCRRLDDADLPNPNGLSFEVCELAAADVWTLYGHITGEGAQAIGDFLLVYCFIKISFNEKVIDLFIFAGYFRILAF